jgi:hypothetical protein
MASATGAGECPAIAPMSPRQKSISSWPSMSRSRALRAVAWYTGNPPAHIRIQVIGTPPSRCLPAVAKAAPGPREVRRVGRALAGDQRREPFPVDSGHVGHRPEPRFLRSGKDE